MLRGVHSYLVKEGDTLREIALPDSHALSKHMRELQNCLAQAGRQRFTQCRIHLKADGSYEATYGYDPVDWPALLLADWNFFPENKQAQQ